MYRWTDGRVHEPTRSLLNTPISLLKSRISTHHARQRQHQRHRPVAGRYPLLRRYHVAGGEVVFDPWRQQPYRLAVFHVFHGSFRSSESTVMSTYVSFRKANHFWLLCISAQCETSCWRRAFQPSLERDGSGLGRIQELGFREACNTGREGFLCRLVSAQSDELLALEMTWTTCWLQDGRPLHEAR